jgi:hypothetical protein
VVGVARERGAGATAVIVVNLNFSASIQEADVVLGHAAAGDAEAIRVGQPIGRTPAQTLQDPVTGASASVDG